MFSEWVLLDQSQAINTIFMFGSCLFVLPKKRRCPSIVLFFCEMSDLRGEASGM